MLAIEFQVVNDFPQKFEGFIPLYFIFQYYWEDLGHFNS